MRVADVEQRFKLVYGPNPFRPESPIPGVADIFGIILPNYRVFLILAGTAIIEYMMQSKLDTLTLFCTPFLDAMSTITVAHILLDAALIATPDHARTLNRMMVRGHEYDLFYPSGQKRCSTCQVRRAA